MELFCCTAIQQNPWFSSSVWYKCQVLLHSDRLDGWCEAEYIDALPGFKRKHHDIKVIDGELRFKLGSFKPDRRLGFFGNCWFGGWWNSSDHFWKLHLSGRLGRLSQNFLVSWYWLLALDNSTHHASCFLRKTWWYNFSRPASERYKDDPLKPKQGPYVWHVKDELSPKEKLQAAFCHLPINEAHFFSQLWALKRCS